MACIVITGSSRGIGRGLADAFVRRGHDVVVSGRRRAELNEAVSALAAIGAGKAGGVPCDVARKSEVQALWDHAVQAFGRVDIWINNAGRAVSRFRVEDTAEALVHDMVDSNLKGMIFGSQVALAGFRRQGGGALYNMMGGSFQGKRLTPQMGVYSATKTADAVLTRYLVREHPAADGILIGSISPGLLLSDNFFAEQRELDPAEWQKVRPLMNVLCDHVDDVAPWLVEQMLGNREHGRLIAWMTTPKLLGRFCSAWVLRRRRDVLSRYGI
jgi:NAD(P)-dependent dehydrogenase (short-subunit alcohol dehydrogenase family)